MTKEELEREYYGRRPTEPYSEDDSPNDWANIVQYAEENLGKMFKAIAELEKEKCELLGIIQGKDKVIQELEKENAELKEKVSYLEDNLRVARKDRKNLQLKVGKGLKEFIKDCPYSALKLYANGYYVEQLTKAKEVIKKFSEFVNDEVELDPTHPQEYTDLWVELCEKAE